MLETTFTLEAAITTLVITQSSLGAALSVSWQRFVGTALGAMVGAIVASYFGPHVLVFGACVFILGLLCAVAYSDLSLENRKGAALSRDSIAEETGPKNQPCILRFSG